MRQDDELLMMTYQHEYEMADLISKCKEMAKEDKLFVERLEEALHGTEESK